jgi:hypothetical protein
MARAMTSYTTADNAAGQRDFAWFAEVGLDARCGRFTPAGFHFATERNSLTR